MNRYWTGQYDSAFGDVRNWEDTPGGGSPASSVPGASDTAHFVAGDVDCVLVADVTLGGLETASGYAGDLDLAGYNLSGSSGADFTLAHAGDFKLGSGTLRLDGGALDWTAMLGAVDRGASTVWVTGSAMLSGRPGDRLGNLLVGGLASGSTTLAIGPGTLAVEDLTLAASGTAEVALDTATHAAHIVVYGDLTFDLADSATIAVDQTGAAANWHIHGDVVSLDTSTGGVAWQRGLGTIMATGDLAQQWDWSCVEDRLEAIVIDKGWGTLQLLGSIECDGWTHRGGVFDPNGQDITCGGDFTIEPTAPWLSEADALDGCSISVGGDLTLAGQIGCRLRLRATAAWSLTVTGTTEVRYVEVSSCDATGGTIVAADDGTCVDAGDNLNWRFADTTALCFGAVAAAAVRSLGATAGGIRVTGGLGNVFTPGSCAGAIHD